MFDAYKIGVSIHLTNHVSGALAAIGRDAAKTEAQFALLQKRIDSIKTGLKGGLLATGAGLALAAMFKPAIEDAMKFERAMLRLKDIGGISPKVVMQVRQDALNGKYKGIGAAESVDLVRDLHAAFGDAKEALEFMPLFAGMARVTQGKYGKSAVAGEEDVRALAKVAERRGGTKSPAAMEGAMDLSMKMLNASGGAVTPKDLLAFMARMGAMGNAMSNDGVLKMWALMQEQGGSKAGTALNSAMQNLVNGRGTEGSGSVLRKIGWVDEQKNEEGLKSLYGANWTKHLNKVTANSLKNVDGAKEDMVGWVQSTGLPLIEKYLDKKGIIDPKKREGETVSLLAQALSNRLGADSIALIATQLPRILKDYNIAAESKGLKASVNSYDESPMAKFQELHAKFETAMVNLGLSALPVVIPLVNRLAAAFKTFNEYAQKNPDTIKSVTKGILGIAAALVVLGGATVIVNGIRAISTAMSFAAAGGVSGLAKIGGALTSTIGSLGALGTAAGVASAAFIGWQLGTWFNETYIAGTKFSDWLGSLIAKFLGFFGNKEAQDAVDRTERNVPGSNKLYQFGSNSTYAREDPTGYYARLAKKNATPSVMDSYKPQLARPASVQLPTAIAPLAKPVLSVVRVAQNNAPALFVDQKRDQFIAPRSIQSDRMINNTIVMPNGEVLAKVVTKEQAKSVMRPQAGTGRFDGGLMPAFAGAAR